MAKAPATKAKQADGEALPAVAPVAPGILGERPLNPDTVALINDHKTWEEQLLRRIDWLYQAPNVHHRKVAVAQAHFELAFLALNAAVANHPRVELTGEHAQFINPS